MNKTHLNNLVVSYREGDELALNELFAAINPLIERTSKDIEGAIENAAKFDCKMLHKAKSLVKGFDAKKHDFLSSFKAILDQEKSNFIENKSRKLEETSMEFLAEPENGEALGYQFESTEYVEDEVLFKEKVALLAQGDPKKEIILNQWSKSADDKSISELLAQHFGGKAESHRKFITRFKTECQNRLASDSTL